jgi:hypothetical protein
MNDQLKRIYAYHTEEDPRYGIFDLVKKTWILDCFDEIRPFFTMESAIKYKVTDKNLNSSRYEIRPILPDQTS